MAQPTPYTPTTDFSQQESINASGRSTVNTAALDAELANIETTLDSALANMALLQRDDGRLADLACELHTLSPEVLNLIGGLVLRGLWATSTAYAVNDIVSNGAYTYVCKTAHTSGGSFVSTYWTQFGFTSGADAAQAAAAAQVSAASAASSASSASSSASSASSSASSASSSATSASTNAGTATSQANAASASATSASNSASAAAASAASISLPVPIASGGTGTTTASAARTALGVPANDGTGASGTWGISISGYSGNGIPAGAVSAFAMNRAPSGWLACDGTAVSRTTYATLFAALVVSATATISIASPGVVTWTAHGLKANDPVKFTTTGALPTGLVANTTYYVVGASISTNTFQLSATAGGSAINTSGTQSGTHTAINAPYGTGDGSTTFGLPDLRGEFVRGLDSGRGVDTGRAFGSAQSDDVKAHSHTSYQTGWQTGAAGGTEWVGNLTLTSSSSTGGSETRPRNIAMLYCIKT